MGHIVFNSDCACNQSGSLRGIGNLISKEVQMHLSSPRPRATLGSVHTCHSLAPPPLLVADPAMATLPLLSPHL